MIKWFLANRHRYFLGLSEPLGVSLCAFFGEAVGTEASLSPTGVCERFSISPRFTQALFCYLLKDEVCCDLWCASSPLEWPDYPPQTPVPLLSYPDSDDESSLKGIISPGGFRYLKDAMHTGQHVVRWERPPMKPLLANNANQSSCRLPPPDERA